MQGPELARGYEIFGMERTDHPSLFRTGEMGIEFSNLLDAGSAFLQREKEFFLSNPNRGNNPYSGNANTIIWRHIPSESS